MTKTEQIRKKEFMGVEPIGSLLWKLSLPATVGMLANALYNLVDTIFIGQGVGSLGIAGISIAFPLQMIVSALAQMFGVGAASIVALKLGEGDEESAAKAAGNAMIMAVGVAAIYAILGSIFIDPLLNFVGVTEAIKPYAKDYLSIIYIGSIFLSFAMCCLNIIRAEGNAKEAMFIMLIGTILNVILDPILIFGFNMGIKGAAIATIVSQMSSTAFSLRYFLSGKSVLNLKRSSFVIKFTMVRQTILLGTSTFIRQIGNSIVAILMNNFLGIYGGNEAIAAFGMINKLTIFFLMPMFGIVQGFQPIAGFNFGAKKYSRVRQVMKYTIIVCSLYGLFISIINITFSRQLLLMFGADEQVLKIAIPALRVLMSTMVFIGIQVIGSTYFQAIGDSVPAILFGLSRQFFILIPILLILPQMFGLIGIWISSPIADIIATLVTTIGVIVALKKLPKQDVVKVIG
ncbi:MAG: MATE family efflux transporter [Spirochaetaceae bacterium]|nr:MATE family efflux transporter [Spirochaetaceae bacterium]